MVLIIDDALARIRQFLAALCYGEVQQELRRDYYVTPFPGYAEWKRVTSNLADRQRFAYDLLLFGEPVTKEAARRVWGATVVADLLATQIVREVEPGVLSSDGYSLVSYEGRYAVVSLHASYPSAVAFDSPVYVGPDTYDLVRALPRHGQFQRVLELCAGSGLCSLLLADRAQQVVGTELNAEAVEAARFNVALNGLSDKVDIRLGSLYEPVRGERFDLVLANPPFQPVPATVQHPLAMCANGGSDGLSVLGEVLNKLSEHLTPCGKAFVYAEGLGINDGALDHPFIAARLDTLAQHVGLDITLRLAGRMPIKQLLRLKSLMLARRGKEALAELPRWREMYEGFGATHSYNFVIELSYGDGRLVEGSERRRVGSEPHFAIGKGTYVDTTP